MDRPIRLQHAVEKYLINPAMRTLLRIGLAPRAFALLETTGRRTGRRRLTPVGNGLIDNVFWVVAEHGEGCSYVKNLTAEPRVRVKVGRRWRTGTAALVPTDDGLARRRMLDDRNGRIGRLDGVAFRVSASRPQTVRIDLDL